MNNIFTFLESQKDRQNHLLAFDKINIEIGRLLLNYK